MVLVKLLRTGLGLTSETIHAARDRPSSSDQPSFTSPPPYTTSAIDTVDNAEIPVQNAQVENSINRNIEHQQSNAPQTARDSPPDYLDTYDQDEAIWQLDDMAESVREQPHDETMATVTPDQQETEEEKIKQREALARELVATAGPVPAQYNVFLAQSSFLNAGLEIRIAGSCVRTHLYGMTVVLARMCFCGFWNTWMQLIMPQVQRGWKLGQRLHGQKSSGFLRSKTPRHTSSPTRRTAQTHENTIQRPQPPSKQRLNHLAGYRRPCPCSGEK